jgi:hypothetical protein
MTHSTKIITAVIFFGAAFNTATFAQQSFASATPSYAINSIETIAENSTTPVTVNVKTEARFEALFPKATNLVWSTGSNNYFVSFLNDGRKANASFTKKGKMNYLITECQAEQLPAAFRKAIKNDYAGYSFFNASEIKAHATVAHHAILENSTGFITLKYTSDGVEEIQQVKK